MIRGFCVLVLLIVPTTASALWIDWGVAEGWTPPDDAYATCIAERSVLSQQKVEDNATIARLESERVHTGTTYGLGGFLGGIILTVALVAMEKR